MLVEFRFWKNTVLVATHEIDSDDTSFADKILRSETFDRAANQCCRVSVKGRKWSAPPARFGKWLKAQAVSV